MPPTQHRPVVSFGRELLQALITASKERVEFNFTKERGGFAAAVSMRQRLYQLRNSMRKHNHEHYDMVSGVKAIIRWPTDTPTERVGRGNIVPVDKTAPVKLIVAPQDSIFVDVIRDAGIQDPNIDDVPDTAPPVAPSPEPDAKGEDLLDKILRGEH